MAVQKSTPMRSVEGGPNRVRAIVKRLAETPAVPCPCGTAQRILTAEDNATLSIHRVRIEGRAAKHVHERLTEHYVVLSGSGVIELDDEEHAVGPGDVILIPPGVAHALRGDFEIINVVTPPFDPADERIVE